MKTPEERLRDYDLMFLKLFENYSAMRDVQPDDIPEYIERLVKEDRHEVARAREYDTLFCEIFGDSEDWNASGPDGWPAFVARNIRQSHEEIRTAWEEARKAAERLERKEI